MSQRKRLPKEYHNLYRIGTLLGLPPKTPEQLKDWEDSILKSLNEPTNNKPNGTVIPPIPTYYRYSYNQ